MKTVTSLLVISLITLVILSCGDDPSGPSGSDLTPSVLSLAFTGDSSKIGSDSDQSEALLFSTIGPKGAYDVTASWTICDQSEFASYTLYRSENPDISTDPSAAIVLGVFSDPNTSEYVDDDVSWGKEYYYAIKLTDDDNDSVWSNEPSIIVNPGAPTPSILAVGGLFYYFVELHWSQCPDDDFSRYMLYRSDFPNIQADTNSAICLSTFSQASDTSFIDTSVTSEQTYYYALMTRDMDEYFSWSNEIQVIIPEDPGLPDSVVATVSVGIGPYGICSLPSGEYVYVTNYGDDNISVIRTSDNTVVATVGVNGPIGICSLPSGEYVYVTNYGDDNISVIRTSDNTVVATVSVGYWPDGICSLPSGEYVYVTNSGD
ncbi:MAG: YncE family protein, partial [Candidatus Aegiribacteria sp.]|nr:YncE family protein [Candidatus Aegiribacteria sp.]